MDDAPIPPPPTADSAERALQPAAPTAPPEITPGKGVKETIESILIAFILAFVFRAFIVEAFVIPTGSMATTLLGANMRFTCRDCGYQFEVNYPAQSSANGDDVDIPTRTGPINSEISCPNCRQSIPPADKKNPFVRYGDRILVMKYLYIPWISQPHRWDVVVFKTPQTGLGGLGAPQFTVNYIKRLIALPGEQVRVLFGDVYIRRSDDEPWQIQTKPKFAQDALWRVVYDHDHRPLSGVPAGKWKLPWVHDQGDGWDTGDEARSRIFKFDNASGEGRLYFDPAVVSNGYFTDWLPYNATMPRNDFYNSTDLRLCFFYERKSGDGPLRAKLTKLDHEFSLELLPDRVRLLHTSPTSRKPVEIAATRSITPAALSGPIRVEFANVDYQVTVRLNDELAFQFSYPPDLEDLQRRSDRREQLPLPSVSLEATRQQASLSHISLWRDVYYTPAGSNAWHYATPNYSTKLGPDDYFVMGDNSAASSDARWWENPVDLPHEGDLHAEAGRVPSRFMLGRAFFVYWPAGFRPFKEALESAPSVIPNFGDMRLIH